LKNIFKNNLFIRIAALVFFAFCLVTIIKQQFEFNSIKDEQTQLEEKIEEYADRIEALQEEIEKPFDEKYIKKYAREKLNYRMPEEILFYNDLIK